MNFPSVILILAIATGQLIKLPILNLGVTALDLCIILLNIYGLWRIKFHLQKPPIWIYGALIFIAASIISLIFSPLSLEPIQKLTSFSYTIRFANLILFGWLISLGTYPNLKENITKVLILSGVFLAILGLIQLIFIPNLDFMALKGWDPHYFRTVSTFFDPNFLGVFFVLILILIQNIKNVKISIFPHGKPVLSVGKWEVFGILYLALLTTFSRSAYLMFLISFLVLTILNRSIRLGILTILLSTGLFMGFTGYDKLIAQPRNIDRVQSAEYRLDSWQQGVRMFQENPIFGVGFNSYRYGLEQYGLAGKDFVNSRGASSNDSSFLFIAATTGIVGLTSYLIFLGTLFWGNCKNYIFLSGLIGLIITSFFINTLFYPFLLIWVILYCTAIQEV